MSRGASGISSGAPQRLRWYEHRHYHTATLVIGGIVLVATFYTGVIKKDGDFRNHYLLGRGFLERNPYLMFEDPRDTACTHYPVGRLALDTVFAWPPYRLSRALNWALGLAALVCSLRWWYRMAQVSPPPVGPSVFVAGSLTLLVTLRWLIRDLDDCGQQLLLVWLLSGAAWWLVRGKPCLAGGVLGVAATYKATPLIFLPLLLYKRRWLAALAMLGTLVLLNVVGPALYLGWPKTAEATRAFWGKTRQISAASRQDPTVNGVEEAKHQNRSLTSVLARYLMTFEPGHPLFIPHPLDVTNEAAHDVRPRPHPLFIQFLNLPPRRAGQVISLSLLAMALGLAIRYRRPWRQDGPSSTLATEWAGVMILCAILSPLCWGQHMVLLIPALFLVLLNHLKQGGARWRTVILCLIALLIAAPQRELIGRTLWVVVQSYKVDTVAALLILFLVLSLGSGRAGSRSKAASSPPSAAS